MSTIPPLSALTSVPESLATALSIPVPTSGACALSVGTACRCIFDPIRALLASSCSRKGIKAAATDTVWVGEMSIYWTSSGVTKVNSFKCLAETNSSINLPLVLIVAFA